MLDTQPKTLTYHFDSLVESIYTPVELFISNYNRQKSITRNALWDTGAEISVVTTEVVQQLNLHKYDEMPLSGYGGEGLADSVLVSLMFPHQTAIEDIKVAVADVDPDVGIILGMDIIGQMDFALSNAGGKTLFSFALPPFENKFTFEKWQEDRG
jgi:hypothetical protein